MPGNRGSRCRNRKCRRHKFDGQAAVKDTRAQSIAADLLGLFVQPAVKDLSLPVAGFTLAIAVQNLSWGFLQPLAGAWVVLYALGLLAMGFLGSTTANSNSHSSQWRIWPILLRCRARQQPNLVSRFSNRPVAADMARACLNALACMRAMTVSPTWSYTRFPKTPRC